MNKRDKSTRVPIEQLYAEVAEDVHIKPVIIKAVIRSLLPIMRNHVLNGHEVELPGFGKFVQPILPDKITHCKSEDGTPRVVFTPGSLRIAFQPEKLIKEYHYLKTMRFPEHVPEGMQLSKQLVKYVHDNMEPEAMRKFFPDLSEEAFNHYMMIQSDKMRRAEQLIARHY